MPELPLGEHTGGTATCIKKAICDVCHQEYGDFAAHNYIENAETEYLKTAATCGSKAVYYKSCSACGGKSEETFETGEYDYTNHVGETYLKNQKEPPAMKRATPETFIAAPAIVKSAKVRRLPKMLTIRLLFGQPTKRITGKCARSSAAETSLTKRRTAAVRQPA